MRSVVFQIGRDCRASWIPLAIRRALPEVHCSQKLTNLDWRRAINRGSNAIVHVIALTVAASVVFGAPAAFADTDEVTPPDVYARG